MKDRGPARGNWRREFILEDRAFGPSLRNFEEVLDRRPSELIAVAVSLMLQSHRTRSHIQSAFKAAQAA